MDTEGYVLPVLHGMVDTLEKSNPVLMIELNKGAADNQQAIDFVEGLGYRQFGRYDVDHLFKRN